MTEKEESQILVAAETTILEEDDDVCRICRHPGDAHNPLSSPCACKGSIKFVHQHCLFQWLNHSNARQCEVCKHDFPFSLVNGENASTSPPLQEFVVAMAIKARHAIQFFIRLSFLLSLWLLIIPFMTFWIWNLAFVRNFWEAQTLFLSHFSIRAILTRCLHGFLLFTSIVFVSHAATLLRDYFRHLLELEGPNIEKEYERDGNYARAARLPQPLRNMNLAWDGNGEDAVASEGIFIAALSICKYVKNVAARWEMQKARLEAHLSQLFCGLDDDGAEHVLVDGIAGVQGPVLYLVENVLTVLEFNMISIAVVIFFPFSIGRLVLSYSSFNFYSSSGPHLSTVVSDISESSFSLSATTLKNASVLVRNVASDDLGNCSFDQVPEILKSEVASFFSGYLTERSIDGATRLSDYTTLAIGYMLMLSLAVFYLAVVALIRYKKGESLTKGRFYGIASTEILSLIRKFSPTLEPLMTITKLASVLAIEFCALPLMCGWWLDVCTIILFGQTMADRIQFFSIAPFDSSMIHWVSGIVCMLQIRIFFGLLREVLDIGEVFFSWDDPHYNPFRFPIDNSVHKNVQRVFLSFAIYGSLIVLFVYLPAKLVMRMVCFDSPLEITAPDLSTYYLAKTLVFKIVIPFAIYLRKLCDTLEALLCYWVKVVCPALGITNFLLPIDSEYGAQENVNRGVLASVDSNVEEEHSDVDEQSGLANKRILGIVSMLVVGGMAIQIFNSALIVVSTSLGRALFNAISVLPITDSIRWDDIDSFAIGSYAIWGARCSINHFREMWRWFKIVVNSSALLSIWFFVIPLLIGLIFHVLEFFPLFVPVDEISVGLYWLWGLVLLHWWFIWVTSEYYTVLKDDSWQIKFNRVIIHDGFSNLQGVWVLREIMFPIIWKLLVALCGSYVFAGGVFPALRFCYY